MNRVRCWNPSSNDSHIVVNMSQYGLTYARASTIAATDRWLAVGGFAGDLLIKPLGETPHDPEPPPVAKTISRDPLSITNHLCPIRQDRLLVSSNDCVVRVLDMSSMSITEAFTFPYPINVPSAAFITNQTPVGKLRESRGRADDGHCRGQSGGLCH